MVNRADDASAFCYKATAIRQRAAGSLAGRESFQRARVTPFFQHLVERHRTRGVLAFEETFASDFIAKRLEAWGIEIHRGLAKTGVVGTIRGKALASGSKTRVIGLRADIDALDIHELNDLPYKSKFPGKMLAYNCSPSFNWKKHLSDAQIARESDFGGFLKWDLADFDRRMRWKSSGIG